MTTGEKPKRGSKPKLEMAQDLSKGTVVGHEHQWRESDYVVGRVGAPEHVGKTLPIGWVGLEVCECGMMKLARGA